MKDNSKNVLLSIRPLYCKLIAEGTKTVEIRKSKPKLTPPFTAYIYCSKPQKHFSVGGGLAFSCDDLYRGLDGTLKYGDSLELMLCEDLDESYFYNGKIVGKFTCDRIVPFYVHKDGEFTAYGAELQNSQLTDEQIRKYIGHGKKGYSWHISDFVLFDKPKLLNELDISRAPQSWQYITEHKE